MKDRLKARLPNATDQEIDNIAELLSRYNIQPSVKNIDQFGFRFEDLKGRSVRLRVGEWRDRTVHIQQPEADVVIVSVSGIISGWIETAKLEDLQDRRIVELKSLNPMPDIFSFDQTCSHLSDWGGFFEGDYWQCANCNRRLIFNDIKKM